MFGHYLPVTTGTFHINCVMSHFIKKNGMHTLHKVHNVNA